MAGLRPAPPPPSDSAAFAAEHLQNPFRRECGRQPALPHLPFEVGGDRPYGLIGVQAAQEFVPDHRPGPVHLLGPAAPYNLKAANGVSSTTATVAAAALGIRDVGHLTEAQRRGIQRAHLLLAL